MNSFMDMDWIEQGLTLKYIKGRETVLQVKRPNQQHQSTEGKVGQP